MTTGYRVVGLLASFPERSDRRNRNHPSRSFSRSLPREREGRAEGTFARINQLEEKIPFRGASPPVSRSLALSFFLFLFLGSSVTDYLASRPSCFGVIKKSLSLYGPFRRSTLPPLPPPDRHDVTPFDGLGRNGSAA